MSFERGSLGFSLFSFAGPWPQDAVSRFASESLPPLDSPRVVEARGWVGGRHLLDRPVSEENARLGGFLRLTLLHAVRRVPPALFRAHAAIEEIAWMKAEGRDFVPRRERAEIRRAVLERLLPEMPPQLRGIGFVVDEGARVAYAEALSAPQQDLLRAHVLRATGVELTPLSAATAAARRGSDVRDWSRTSFSAEADAGRVSAEPGDDFLTWLLFLCETRGGIFRDAEHGDFALSIDGPLTLTMEGDGAHETVLRKGMPRVSAEAGAGLRGGKKLRQARLTIGRPGETWSFRLGAEGFWFRGMKLPEPDPPCPDPAGRFQDRMLRLSLFRDVFLGLFDRFLDERLSPGRWDGAAEAMREWVRTRPARN